MTQLLIFEDWDALVYMHFSRVWWFHLSSYSCTWVWQYQETPFKNAGVWSITLFVSPLWPYHCPCARRHMKPIYHKMARWSQNNGTILGLATLLSWWHAIIQQWPWPHDSWWQETFLLVQHSLHVYHIAAVFAIPLTGISKDKGQLIATDQF
jgi:hypothetical protein